LDRLRGDIQSTKTGAKGNLAVSGKDEQTKTKKYLLHQQSPEKLNMSRKGQSSAQVVTASTKKKKTTASNEPLVRKARKLVHAQQTTSSLKKKATTTQQQQHKKKAAVAARPSRVKPAKTSQVESESNISDSSSDSSDSDEDSRQAHLKKEGSAKEYSTN